ncbi:M3 family metallopeptidase [Paenibacillus spongiae]|uniref:M3 family metallopeptidase n=1 Tax=Paenibacillus spongiae TaxID=2909671 RepID=A0ABY5S0B1_9BACL|nr:M3 family metallopeptidase [Paenibacillus spongiae]UVI27281.1 M3 family metallopeptidase [Paenibacillus spongiae]
MQKFSELKYISPNYEVEKAVLLKYKEEMATASTYMKFRDSWLSRKNADQYLDMLTDLAYIRFLTDTSDTFYKNTVHTDSIEDPLIKLLRKECDDVLLDSPYMEEIAAEFGDKMIQDMRIRRSLSGEKAVPLQLEENRLSIEYNKLVSSGKSKEAMSCELDELYDSMINVRTNLAKSLGFDSFIEMAYRIQGRVDYGKEDISSFRSQVLEVITPACAAFEKDRPYDDSVPIGAVGNIVHNVRNIFHDISQESGDFIDFIYDHELFDVEPRPNKRPFYCCCMLPHYKAPFIISDLKGKGNDALMFIHELGHGFAFYTAARSQKLFEYHRSTVSINEVHSKTMELLSYPYLELIVGEHKDLFRWNHLYEALRYLPYRCAIDEFEHNVYENTVLTKSQRSELWREIEQKYMPWRAGNNHESVKRGTSWHSQPHLFNAPFSYIDYNFAQISAFEFYGRSKINYQETWKEYLAFCSKGGSTNYLNLLAAGKLVNPFSVGAVADICAPILNELYA